MKKLILIVIFFVCSPTGSFAFNDDLKQVAFSFDNIPCGEGSMWGKKGFNLNPSPVSSDFNGIPVISHVYFKFGKSPNEVKFKPLDWYAILPYYKEQVGNEYNFTLIGYVRRFYLGNNQKEIKYNYNKIYNDLISVLGAESKIPAASGKADLNKTSIWFMPRNEKGISITLSAVDLGNDKYASVETVCGDEFEKAYYMNGINNTQNNNLFR